VFVRMPGKTRQATSNDVRNLEDRRERSSNKGAAVAVGYTGTYDYVDNDVVTSLVWDAINVTRDQLIFDLHRTSNPMTGNRVANQILRQTSGLGENRTREEFAREVAAWHEEAGQYVDYAVLELLRHHLALAHFTVKNTSPADTYLSGVHLEVFFPPGCLPLAASDTAYYDDGEDGFDLSQLLPGVPKKWGTSFGARIHMPTDLLRIGHVRAQSVSVENSTIEHAADGTRVAWDVGDLPGRKSVSTTETFAVIASEKAAAVDLKWQATARGVDYVFEGLVSVAHSAEHATLDVRRLL